MAQIFDEILKLGFRTNYKKREYLFYRGDIGNCFYIIEKGSVELSIFDTDGESVILAELKKGDFFGQVEIFTNGVRLTNACVQPGTILVSFTALVLKEFLAKNNDKSLEMIKGLCSLIDQGVSRIEDILILNAYQKVSKKLYEISRQSDTNHVYLSQKKISEHLAISERTTNVSLKKLKQKGAIFIRRSRIEILNAEILKKEFSVNKDAA